MLTIEKLQTVFLKNDIRGVYGDVLSPDFGTNFGMIIGDLLPEGNVVIGGDVRSHTEELKSSIIDGLVKSGRTVIDVKVAPTPCIYYLAASMEDVSAGIIVTASHNPKEYNGIKVCDQDGASYSYDTLFSKVLKLMAEGKELADKVGGRVTVNENLKLMYISHLRSIAKYSEDVSVVFEFGNGTAFLLKELSDTADMTFLGDLPDPNFPRFIPDPAKPNMYSELSQVVRQQNADLGVAFDTDGDRVGFVDEMGQIISPEYVAMLFLEDIAKTEAPNGIVDVKMSNKIAMFARSIGGIVEYTPTGHSIVHENLLHKNYPMAAELSCHYYFTRHYFGFDDGLYAAVIFLRIVDKLKQEGLSLGKKIASLPQIHTSKEYRKKMDPEKIDRVIRAVEEYGKEYGAKIIKLDGMRLEFEDGWMLVRKSGTEAKISYRVEGDSPELTHKYLSLLENIIEMS